MLVIMERNLFYAFISDEQINILNHDGKIAKISHHGVLFLNDKELEIDIKVKTIINYLQHNLTDKLWNYCEKWQKEWIDDYNHRYYRWKNNIIQEEEIVIVDDVEYLTPYSKIEEEPDYNLEVKTQPYICFNGAEFISSLFLSKPDQWANLKVLNQFFKQIKREEIDEFSAKISNGVYLVDLDTNNESHSFVIYIHDDKLTVMNTYGGNENIYITTFNKNQWINDFNSFWTITKEEQEQLYHRLFGFPKDIIVIGFDEPIEFEGLSVAKIN